MRVKLIGEFRKDRHFLLKVDDSIEKTHYLGIDTTKMSECNMNMNMNSNMHDVCMNACYVMCMLTKQTQDKTGDEAIIPTWLDTRPVIWRYH